MAYNRELFDCSICLQLLEDPVTTGCGHSYCMECINTFWDKNNNRGRSYSCPQCRESFHPRPVLKRNTLLAELLDKHRGKPSQKAADNDTYAAPGDVPCDVCTGRKRKACKFCLVCLASFCEVHLQPHNEVPPLQKHSLIPASARTKESICDRHDKLLEIYCRTDQQFICLLCVVDEHKGHDTVAVAAEKSEMQRRLKRTEEEISDRVLNSNRKIAKLKQAADSIRRKCSEMRDKVGEVEKAGVDWTNSGLGQLQHEVSELRRREEKLNQLSLTDNPIQFLKDFQALGDLPVFTDAHDKCDKLTEFVTAQIDKLKNMCNKEKKELFINCDKSVVSKIPRLQQEISSRTGLFFANKRTKVEVDPCTVAACLCLSDSDRKILWSDRDQGHPDHPDRFTYYHQALCKDGLQGNHYWEVKWDGGIIELAVSYKSIKRKGSGKECRFGHNNVSWKLICSPSGCMFWHNNLHKGQIPVVDSRRVGIHLDYEEGRLSFYSVSDRDTLTLLHHIQTTFTEPLYPGFAVDLGATLEICNI
ncbi:E3 ubiquitin-protein ligase TRIM47-like isoform X3 [Anabas testudineus]|uniref:E3 ubiquitin-protein ligase TRIM47-like isoform X3 n=1 Tax=Anabas testudineus TaxID=64144 RepID=UPI000E45EB19|nr:E3 ubiquitin-protein ligase TRIM47-like isoform X3 [Anabas testudineus]